jgi:hypothetical protein
MSSSSSSSSSLPFAPLATLAPQPKRMRGRDDNEKHSAAPLFPNTSNKRQKEMTILPYASFSSSAAAAVPRVVDVAAVEENYNTMASINNVGLRAIKLMDLTASLRVCIFNYLGQTQEELVNLTVVSKQVYEDCKRPGIEWKIIISMIEISPKGGGSERGLLRKLQQHLLDNKTNKKLLLCFHMKVIDVHKFGSDSTTCREVKEMTTYARMDSRNFQNSFLFWKK